MVRPLAPDYGQQFLLPPALEDWVPQDHPARFLREFVEQLDLPKLGFAAPAALEGRPAYAPSLLLKIWLYGYFQRIRSTRKLEAACRDHLPLLWLAGLLAPDHNSLWRFWDQHKAALRTLFKQTVQVAVQAGAVGFAWQALDGTRIPAAASGLAGWSKDYMEKMLQQLDASLADLELKVIQENSQPELPGCRLPAGLAEQKTLRAEIQKGLAQLQADQRQHYHPVEPEARRMKTGAGNRFAYNAQAVVDQKEGIVLAAEATRQETDVGQLAPMLEQARHNAGPQVQEATTLADTGYGSGADLKRAAEQGLKVLIPPADGAPPGQNPYATQHFHYDPQAQTVTCPQQRLLDHEGQTTKAEQMVQRYRCHHRDCPVRAQCTRDPKGRQIEVWPHTAVVQAMRARWQAASGQKLYRQRSGIIERRFGQIKEHDGFRRWTVWGLEAVRTQWSLLCTTLNLRVLYQRWQDRTTGRSAAAVKAALAGLALAA
jgi:transposase